MWVAGTLLCVLVVSEGHVYTGVRGSKVTLLSNAVSVMVICVHGGVI